MRRLSNASLAPARRITELQLDAASHVYSTDSSVCRSLTGQGRTHIARIRSDPRTEWDATMSEVNFTSIEEYQTFLAKTLASWTPPRPLALAAIFAEHWFRDYEDFSSLAEWGDPEALRRGVDLVWKQVLGNRSSNRDRKHLIRAIEEVTPHMDDFDAIRPLMACVVVADAVRVCDDTTNATIAACDMAIDILENLLEEDWPEDQAEQAVWWESDVIQAELRAQLRLIEAVEAVPLFDESMVTELRQAARHLVAAPPPPAPVPRVTNEEIFNRYHEQVARVLVTTAPPEEDPNGDSQLTAMSFFGVWLARYMLRLRMVNGEWGKLFDQAGPAALLAKNRADDAAGGDSPDWGEKAEVMLRMCMQNNHLMGTVDVDDLFKPHAYGPSLRRLWQEGRQRGDTEGWSRIGEWATSRLGASARDEETAATNKELLLALNKPVVWKLSGDPEYPWVADVDKKRWTVGLNDYPDEPMYRLIVNGNPIGHFHEWPDCWGR